MIESTAWIGPGEMVAAVATAAATMALVRAALPFRRRLGGRVQPYTVAARARLGRPVAGPMVHSELRRMGAVRGPRRLLWTVVRRLQDRHRMLTGADPAALRRRLAQADHYAAPEDLLVTEHRVRQALAAAAGAVVGGGLGTIALLPPAALMIVTVLAMCASYGRVEAAVQRALERRRALLRAEVPPVAQLLALRLHAGASLPRAVQETVARCHGEMAAALRDALAQHRAGRPLDAALDAIAETTCEPQAGRVFRMLAGAVRHGVDIAPQLLRVAREGRSAHLARLRREATRRRAALLLPTIGLLAPLMLVFVAAPLPSLVLGA